MKKLILKYWLIYLLISIVLFVAYRIAIIKTIYNGSGLLGNILDILDILLNIGFSFIYLAAMMLCSFAVFLNHFKKIRDKSLYSWLTFSGAAVIIVITLIINLFIEGASRDSITLKLVLFSILYLFLTVMLFFMFRKAMLATAFN
ncbi:hypothetical protein [Mucilaginibacter sp. KACC 22063]|uniref:hypothetical protein n=1 Tax=Mucilaginibacter sp. KACC 22063 TaxID=3025666 RepID=UPI0023653396|nr:hypothetical protein [Mucilaginibacter sp. KACC 22063]WDF55581.1 hypothetical protein PQ461_00730 [Mucilaginibacter sp. KACC 22063]